MKYLLILLISIVPVLAFSQMGEALGTEVMRQELEEANESDEKKEVDIYDENDSINGPRYDDKPTEKVNEEIVESTDDGIVDEVIEEEETFTEDKYESSSWAYIILALIGLLAIFAFYRYKIGKNKID
jgi:hypothetical protein